MSVTITIAGNRDFCIANNLVGENRYDCQTCDFDGKSPTCRECKGKGYVAFEDLPFEMNAANGNFRTLFASLALDAGEYLSGSIHPNLIFSALQAYDPELCERESRVEVGARGAQIIHCGISLEQSRRYTERLLHIVLEAQARNEAIVWG